MFGHSGIKAGLTKDVAWEKRRLPKFEMFEDRKRERRIQPERNLYAAILADAVVCAFSLIYVFDHKGEAEQRRAKAWLMGEEGATVSVLECVERLSIDYSSLQRLIGKLEDPSCDAIERLRIRDSLMSVLTHKYGMRKLKGLRI